MKLRLVLSSVALVVLTTGAAVSAPLYCTDHRSNFEDFDEWDGFGLFRNDPEAERNERDLVALRQRGVDATRVERWSGCIRAFVRQPGGGETMQFFDPNNYREIPVG